MTSPPPFDTALIYCWELHPLGGSATVGNSSACKSLERVTGTDPVSLGWKPRAQPLYQTRMHALTSRPADLPSGLV